MADMLNIGTAATNTFRRAIEVTSHNVANVGTEGYSRQRADIISSAPSNTGYGFLGAGSRVSSIDRVYADYIQTQLVDAYSLKSRYDEQLSLSKQVEGVVASNDKGLQTFMQNLFDSFQNLSNNPTSSTSRDQVLSEANNMEAMLLNMSTVLGDTQEQVNGQIKNMTDEINKNLTTIQAINNQVANSLSNGGQPPNDLLDQREKAIKELGQYMDIKTFRQEDGRIDIHTGNGRYPLISDNTLTTLNADLTDYKNENRIEVYMQIGGQKVEVSDNIKGGQLGGVLDFRNNLLDRSMNEMGVALNGLVASTNWQHYQGYDQNGNPGQDFFTPLSTNAIQSAKNTGPEDGTNIQVSFNPVYDPTAPVQGTNPPYDSAAVPPAADAQPPFYGDKQTYLGQAMSAIGEFEPREYKLQFSTASNGFEIKDNKTGDPVLDSAGNPVLITLGAPDNGFEDVEGLRFDVTNVAAAPADGDTFIVKPHQAMLEDFSTSINSGEEIATRGQSPVDTGVAGLADETPTPASVGDNVNIANMASLQSKKVLYSDASGNASETLLGGFSKMATNVGMYVRGTEIQLTSQENVFDQVNARRESYSGVNLDEEAANLLRFQQAYQASAQIIQTSQSLFQSLLGAVRL
ncbi:Flagellar hook-associated protein 1 [Hydrogenovibrio crunogenus]|uniref:Flagellar hook-associated protein 1 n=1 Tax=Hydrogenovibrio crunogenus TaxID=39765 RepID=A0A4V1C8Y2_9GAMM|nr:flagellar hook-associated protein FlgK [Hydrogenovibrio crunogenus]QBZ83494.1 Flagellar hook-associated protein 1 [Hydrogenovibrio crunogenus]